MKKSVRILVAAGLILCLAACGDAVKPSESENAADVTVSSAPQQTQEADPVQMEESTVPESGGFTVGDVVTLDDVVVTLVNVSESAGGNYMTPDDEKVFVLCEFNIENNSDKDIAVSSIMSFKAYIDDYSANMDLSAVLSSDKGQLDGTVAAGKKMNGVIGYQADKDWRTLELTFTPDIFFGHEATFVYTK